MSFEEYQRHLAYRNETILAILNLHVAIMPPTKFHLARLTVQEEMSETWKVNDGRTNDGQHGTA